MAGLYIHIPFCVRKCRYCDFVSYAEHTHMGEYVGALEKEILLAAEIIGGKRFDSVFFGGGTPSILPNGEISRIMRAARRSLDIAPDAELSIEVNPGAVDAEKLREYREAGFNRLSIGLQSADDALLRRVGRIHTFEQFLCCYSDAREAGFNNINIDVMAGLPGQTRQAYENTLQKVLALAPEHISAYSLILEQGTPLYGDVESGAERLPSEDETCDMTDEGMATLEAADYARYEISNYAQTGRQCAHNVNYWENGEYLGLGAAAHSALALGGKWQRFENPTALNDYIESIKRGSLAHVNAANVEKSEEMFESVMLGLRMIKGVDAAAFQDRYGVALNDAYGEKLRLLKAKGWLEQDDKGARLTAMGLDMYNAATLELYID